MRRLCAEVNETSSIDKNRLSERIAVLLILLAGIVMAWVSWQKWCDPIIDFGRELYIPWLLCQGKVLYKDINMFFYGPFSYYLNALVFRIFGININILVGFNLVLISITTYIVYKVIKSASTPLCAFLAALSFIILFAFPRYLVIGNYNFVTPYAHAATHGMVLSLLSLFFMHRYVKTDKLAYAYLCWFVVGLILLTKVEIFAAIFSSMLLSWSWILWTQKEKASTIVLRFMTFIFLMVVPLFLAVVFFSRFFSFCEAVLHILNPYFLIFHRGHSFSPFSVGAMGLDQPLANTHRMLSWLCIYVSVALILMAVNHLLTTVSKNTKHRGLSALAFLITLPFIDATIKGSLPYLEYFVPIPLIVTLYSVYMMFRLRKIQSHDTAWGKTLMCLSLSVFALVLLARRFLNVNLIHYGFFLILPGFLILLIIVFDLLPSLMKRITGETKFGMVPIVVLIACIMYSYFSHSLKLYNMMNYPIESNREVIKSFDLKYADTSKIIQEAIDRIDAMIGPNQTFTVFPEGLMFNYLTRRQSPSPYTAFLPTFFSVFDKAILESLQEKPPDFVLLVERSTIEYGYRYFGIDYATEVFDWILENYIEVSQIGKRPLSGEGFGIIIMKRISS